MRLIHASLSLHTFDGGKNREICSSFYCLQGRTNRLNQQCIVINMFIELQLTMKPAVTVTNFGGHKNMVSTCPILSGKIVRILNVLVKNCQGLNILEQSSTRDVKMVVSLFKQRNCKIPDLFLLKSPAAL